MILYREGSWFKKRSAQVTLEYTFAMIGVVLLIIGMVRVFTWSGRDLFERQRDHEETLISPIGRGIWEPLYQTKPVVHTKVNIGATVNSSVFGDANP